MMRRKAACISLFLCLVVPLVATFSYLYYQKVLIREEVLHQMFVSGNTEELVLFKFTEEETQTKLRWEHSSEFEYEDNMYDIVGKEIKGDTTYYWCWWDHEETMLNRQIDDLTANVFGSSPQKKKRQEKLVEFYKNLYCNSYSTSSFPVKEIKTNIHIHSYCYSTIYYSPPVPPPRFS